MTEYCSVCKNKFKEEIYLTKGKNEYICRECLGNVVNLARLFDDEIKSDIEKILDKEGLYQLLVDMI